MVFLHADPLPSHSLQDLGNLNITMFTHRHDYHRPRNLELVCDAINKKWGTGLHSNKRDDILYHDHWKVSSVEMQ